VVRGQAVGWLACAAVAVSLAGCGGGSTVDASCDVDGVSHEIEHILSEADAELGTLTSLSCADDWAHATVQVVEPTGERAESFLLRGSDMGWILSSPMDACVEGGPIAIPEALRDVACAAEG